MLRYCSGDTSRWCSGAYTQRNPKIGQAFRLEAFGDYVCDSNYSTERTELDQLLLLYTLEGEGELHYNQTTAILKPGTTVILDCYPYQCYKTRGEEGWHFLWIHFSADSARELAAYINGNDIFAPQLSKSYFLPQFQQVQALSNGASVSQETELSLLLHTLMTKMVSLKTTQTSTCLHRLQPQMERALQFMQTHYTKTVHLDEICAVAHISKYYFIKIFREMTGITPYRYLLLMRVDEAKRLLRQTTFSLSEIAGIIGFCDEKNFVYHFKKITGLTPLKYRMVYSS